MSSLDEDQASVSRVEFHPERGQQARTLGFALGSGQKPEGKGEGQGPFPDPEGFVRNQHVSEVAGQVAQGCEGRPASGAAFEGATPAPFGNRVAVAIPQWLTKRDAWGFCSSPFPESSNRQVSAVWGPEGGGTRGSPKQGVRYRSNASVGRQRAFEEGLDSLPWSESESSDEFSERQLRRVSTCQIGGGWAKHKSLNDTGSLWRSPVREEFLPMPGPCLSFRCREAGQAGRDPEVSSKEAHSDSWGKRGSRPSYLPLVAAAGGLPKATPRWKVAQEKRSLEGASEVVREGFFHLRGQRRGSGAPQDAATLSRISAVPLLGTGTSHALTPFGTKESKPTGTGQESVAQRNSGSEPVVGEGDDKEPSREPFPESESLPHGQSTSYPCGHGGECDRGAVKNRHTQDTANLEPLALSEEQVLASGPAPSSDLEPPEELPRPERLQQPQPQPQQPSGAEACPQLMLSLAPRNAAKVKDLICVLVKEICSQLYISPPPPCTSWRRPCRPWLTSSRNFDVSITHTIHPFAKVVAAEEC
ncbi:uncharacterized protein CXorf49 homolog, partial [Artibeus jamaicensis]|uniref:uncharacterized protein CXorf49 homolog n=1 Tax=Artibeus jamaicensis TaxID=9417 RepID=UPI00235AD740